MSPTIGSASSWMIALVNKFPLMGASRDGMTSQAMQQGGMGLILTTLFLAAPPMATMFFQGTLGSFMAYPQIGGSPVAQAPGPSG
jgi:type IV secretion system protein VirB6